jgi:VWFA-related protein
VGFAQLIEQLTINYIEVSPAPEHYANSVSAYVTVSSTDEKPITGLLTSDFEALEDGSKIEISEVQQTTDPMAVVLAIDTSGSMEARDRSGKTSIDAAKRAAIDFIHLLSENDKIAIFSFNNDSTLNLDFTSDHQAAIDAVSRLSAKSKAATCLYDTAIETVKKAAEIPKGRRAIIILTDGKDEKGRGACSIHSLNDVIDAATTKTIRVPIYTIGAGSKVDAKELARIASLTGGRSLLAASMDELTDFYQTIAYQLKNQYKLIYITRTPSGEHSLVIKARSAGRQGQDEKRFWSPPVQGPQPPTVSFIRPRMNDKIAGIVIVSVRLTPAETITKVKYYVDAVLKKEFTSAPFQTFNWDTTDLSPGLHVLRVEAADINKRIGSAELTVKVTAPSIEFLSPNPNDLISGSVSVTIRITSREKLSELSYFVDNVQMGKITSGPLETFTVDTTSLVPGTHTLKVAVADAHGRIGYAQLPIRIIASDSKSTSVFLWITILLILLSGIALGLLLWLRFRKKESERKPPQPDEKRRVERMEAMPEIEDETMLISDAGMEPLAPRATIKIIQSPGIKTGKTIEIIGTTKIGRNENNDIRIPEKSVSRKHAEIYFDGTTFCIRDLGSKYGTTVDQRKVSSEVVSIPNNAQIQLSPNTVLEFHCAAFDEEPDENASTIKSPPVKKASENTVPVNDITIKSELKFKDPLKEDK